MGARGHRSFPGGGARFAEGFGSSGSRDRHTKVRGSGFWSRRTVRASAVGERFGVRGSGFVEGFGFGTSGLVEGFGGWGSSKGSGVRGAGIVEGFGIRGSGFVGGFGSRVQGSPRVGVRGSSCVRHPAAQSGTTCGVRVSMPGADRCGLRALAGASAGPVKSCCRLTRPPHAAASHVHPRSSVDDGSRARSRQAAYCALRSNRRLATTTFAPSRLHVRLRDTAPSSTVSRTSAHGMNRLA